MKILMITPRKLPLEKPTADGNRLLKYAEFFLPENRDYEIKSGNRQYSSYFRNFSLKFSISQWYPKKIGLAGDHNSFLPPCRHITRLPMPRAQKRKYEKIDDAEIDLVIQCNDSHEFYERYREAFPTRKKGIDSISKIWKRRGEFLKKQSGTIQESEQGNSISHELELLVSTQNKIRPNSLPS